MLIRDANRIELPLPPLVCGSGRGAVLQVRALGGGEFQVGTAFAGGGDLRGGVIGLGELLEFCAAVQQLAAADSLAGWRDVRAHVRGG